MVLNAAHAARTAAWSVVGQLPHPMIPPHTVRSSSTAPSTCSISCRSSAITSARRPASTKISCTGSASPCASRWSTPSSTATRTTRQARHRRVQPGAADRRRRARDSHRRPGRGLRARRSRRPAGAREHPQVERPRHLPDSQLHGRNGAEESARAAWRSGWSRSSKKRARDPASAKATAVNPTRYSSPPPIEAVVRAGEIQMAKFGTGVRVDKKGAIDLVTEVDLEVERMFRALVAERFPDHDVLAEELGGGAARRAASLGVRSARRHHQLRARRADLLRLARARDRRRGRGGRGLRSESQGAVHRGSRRRRVAQRPAAARCRRTPPCSSRCWSPAFRTTCTRRPTSS